MKELFENNRDNFKKKLRHVMAESEERASSPMGGGGQLVLGPHVRGDSWSSDTTTKSNEIWSFKRGGLSRKVGMVMVSASVQANAGLYLEVVSHRRGLSTGGVSVYSHLNLLQYDIINTFR